LIVVADANVSHDGDVVVQHRAGTDKRSRSDDAKGADGDVVIQRASRIDNSGGMYVNGHVGTPCRPTIFFLETIDASNQAILSLCTSFRFAANGADAPTCHLVVGQADPIRCRLGPPEHERSSFAPRRPVRDRRTRASSTPPLETATATLPLPKSVGRQG